MITKVISRSDNSRQETHVGQIVCRTRHQLVLLITHPYNMAGRIVEIPVSSIIEEVEGGVLPRGAKGQA